MLVPRFCQSWTFFFQFIQLEKLYILFVQLRYSHWLFQGRSLFGFRPRGGYLPPAKHVAFWLCHFFQRKRNGLKPNGLKSDPYCKYRGPQFCEKFVRFMVEAARFVVHGWLACAQCARRQVSKCLGGLLVTTPRSNLTRNFKIDGHPHPS